MPDQPRANEVTFGEVYRAIIEVRQEQRDMRRDLIGRAEYEADQEGLNRRLTDIGQRIEAVDAARVAGEHKADEAKRWAIGVLIAGGGLFVTVVLFIMNIANGGPL